MTAKDPVVRLDHMVEHITGIIAALESKTDIEIANDYASARALERAVEIISEAARHVPVEIRSNEADVPWHEIIAIGNMLRHEYFRIKDAEMVAILRRDLPALLPAVQRLIDKLNAVPNP